MSMTLTGEVSWQRLRRSAVDFYWKTKNSLFEPPFSHLGVTYAFHLWLVGKPVVDFIFVVIELFSLSPTVETLWAEIGRSRRFSTGRGWVTLSADFRGKGASPTNHCWCQNTRVIAVSCGIKIFAVHCLVLSQYTHLTDGRTDRQNSDSNTVCCITCSRTVKTATAAVAANTTKHQKQGNQNGGTRWQFALLRHNEFTQRVNCSSQTQTMFLIL